MRKVARALKRRLKLALSTDERLLADRFITTAPSPQNAIDLFKGEWASIFPPPLEKNSGGYAQLFKDDPKGGKTFDAYTRKSDRAGCLTSAGFWVAMVVACFGLQRCGVINMRSTRTPTNALPAVNVRPNLNYNLNWNYNARPVNLPPLTAPTPPRERRRRPKRNDNATPALQSNANEPATPAR